MDGLIRARREVKMCHLLISLAGAHKRSWTIPGGSGAQAKGILKLWPSPGHWQLHLGSDLSNGEILTTGQELAGSTASAFTLLRDLERGIPLK